MTSRRLLVLGVVALAAIGAGIWLASRQSGSVEGYGALYPDLAKQLDSVTAVRIFKPGDERGVEIARRAEPSGRSYWGVSERAGYPADETKLRKLLRGLADAKLQEEKTSRPEQYEALGVEDLGEADASGVRVELAGTAAPVNLIVGKRGLGAQSTYVRRAGEAQSWLVDASLDASSAPDTWLRKDILDISADRIQSATIDSAEAKAYTAAKSSRADADFKVEGLPKGKKPSSPSAANGLATALSALTLSDVQQADAFDADDADAHATYKTFDGLVVEVDGWKREDKHYIALKTTFEPAQAERFEIPTAPAEQAAAGQDAAAGKAQGEKSTAEGADANATPAKTPAKTPEKAKEAPAGASGETAAAEPDVEAEARDTQARLSGWVYEIPSYKYEGIFKPVDQLY